jgi:TetR/AcrR family transcriptional regulator
MKTGELIRTDWMQVIYAVLGANVFYFLSAPMMRLVADFDPLQEREIRRRRKAALLFLGASLFADRQLGERLARQVLADTPLPVLRHKWELHSAGVQSR